MDEYPIYFALEQIGAAKVIKQGLYYRIHCVCKISGSVPFCVKVMGKGEVDLGLCVPMGEYFGLETRIPIKQLGQENLRFEAMPRHTSQDEWTVISADEPFTYIQRLKDAYLIKRGNKTGIGFRTTDQSPNLPGNDPSP